jgi:hypothetical protein
VEACFGSCGFSTALFEVNFRRFSIFFLCCASAVSLDDVPG